MSPGDPVPPLPKKPTAAAEGTEGRQHWEGGKVQPNVEPAPAPLSEALAARLDTRDRLDRRWAAGELDEYGGGYVLSDGDAVFAHGRNLLEVRDAGEAAARAAGVPADRLVDYFVPAGD